MQHKAALQEVKVLQRAKDPWIEELDLGSLLRCVTPASHYVSYYTQRVRAANRNYGR